MATTAKRPKKPNPHTPVSNEPETAEAAPKKPASKPPSEGADAKAVKAKQDGSEAVEGFKLPKVAAEAMAETMRAPATTNLRDIAEARHLVAGAPGDACDVNTGLPVVAATPAPQPPPRPAPRTTTDEIFFDGKSARLTNIAKAVLDGVALRMKNDLNATAVVVGYTDNAGAEQANVELGMKRAEAAKAYLVTERGIEEARVSVRSTEGLPNREPGASRKNRRVEVMFVPSGAKPPGE